MPHASVAALSLCVAGLCLTACTSPLPADSVQPGKALQAQMPAPVRSSVPGVATTGALPPMPSPGYPSVRPLAVVHEVYAFAAQHPEVLQHVPCFCGCQQLGHGANHDCFIRSRDAQGNVTWDDHGYGCTICIDVARDAMQMFAAGASVPAIRAAIDQKWGAQFPSATPTPHPEHQ
ncbi:MAG: hypothetical protein HOP14_07490 [Acidobacteria bacterium]|nr:hypothetical protein [Acidobacteriota bacterium]